MLTWTFRLFLTPESGAEERGASEAEIKEVIDSGFFIPAKRPLGKAKIYTFSNFGVGLFCTERVEVI